MNSSHTNISQLNINPDSNYFIETTNPINAQNKSIESHLILMENGDALKQVDELYNSIYDLPVSEDKKKTL